jgi:hypothetical protein
MHMHMHMSETTATFLAQARAVLVHCRLRRARLGLAPRAPGDISDDDLKQLITDVAMKSGHAARLRTAPHWPPPAFRTFIRIPFSSLRPAVIAWRHWLWLHFFLPCRLTDDGSFWFRNHNPLRIAILGSMETIQPKRH